MTENKLRLQLRKETVRELSLQDLERAAGGSPKQTETCPPLTVTLLCTVTRA